MSPVDLTGASGTGASGTGASGTGASGTGASGTGRPRPARPSRALRLNRHTFGPHQLLVMAVVNQMPELRSRPGVRWDQLAAIDRVHVAVAEGADIVHIGGPARPGDDTDGRKEIRCIIPFVAAVREAHPDLVISVDTGRHEVGREVCAAGADLLNDGWGSRDTRLAEVAAEFGAGVVCSPAGDLPPRTRPFRVTQEDVLDDLLSGTLAVASHAVDAGVDPARILIGPTRGLGMSTGHSGEIVRRLGELAATGWPVLVSDGDFAGETPDAAVNERLAGTLATTAVSAWLGARVFRARHVRETRRVLSMVSTIRGDIPPACAVRGLA
jgi:dihydropteroate synthase